ncbi:MAG: GDP-L-fucose synthase [Caulobacteraceae bacterium]
MPAEPIYALARKRVWVAGHRGMVGSAIARRLAREDCQVLAVERAQLDLFDQARTWSWMVEARPQVVFLAAARVGGIAANSARPADFLRDNLQIEVNVIEGARRAGVEKLIFLGSSCIYPKLAAQPIVEETLLTGPLEPTNEAYAIAKIAGVKLCQAYRAQYGLDFISAMPTNLYGPGDNFDLESSHVLPALMRKAHEARLRGDGALVMWGTGSPRREFLHCDDCADALVHLAKAYSDAGPVNVGAGEDISIADLTALVARVVGFRGEIVADPTKPDGTPRKLLNIERLRSLGWSPTIALEDGVERTYRWFLENIERTAGGGSGGAGAD